MKGGILCIKKEMTKVWKDGKQYPVTLLAFSPQQVVRYKSKEKDGYLAAVVGVNPQSKGDKKTYQAMREFGVDSEFVDSFQSGSDLTAVLLDGQEFVTVRAVSKGKGFQGAMKRFNLKGGNQTRGSKFHRQVGSMGNRKPRRVQKGHPHAGRMGGGLITLKKKQVMGVYALDGEVIVSVKGSVPGSYNSQVAVVVG